MPIKIVVGIMKRAPIKPAGVLTNLFQFLTEEKKYWLVPIVVVLVLFVLLTVFSRSSTVAPFIYTLF